MYGRHTSSEKAERSVLLLDTHVLIWILEGDEKRISSRARRAVEKASQAGLVNIATMTVWEISLLHSRKRVRLSRDIRDWIQTAIRTPGFRLLELTPEIAIDSMNLPGQMHNDPVDRILISSARVLAGRLMTCDKAIVEYGKNGHVNVFDARP